MSTYSSIFSSLIDVPLLSSSSCSLSTSFQSCQQCHCSSTFFIYLTFCCHLTFLQKYVYIYCEPCSMTCHLIYIILFCIIMLLLSFFHMFSSTCICGFKGESESASASFLPDAQKPLAPLVLIVFIKDMPTCTGVYSNKNIQLMGYLVPTPSTELCPRTLLGTLPQNLYSFCPSFVRS